MSKKKKMTAEEIQEWNELYEYVKSNILQYDSNQALPKSIVLRLKGLRNGKFFANNKIESKAEYTDKVILYTFKAYSDTIHRAVTGKDFKSETHKFLYIAAIVENNINNIYMRMNRHVESKEKTESLNIESVKNEGAGYQSKSNDKGSTDSILEELW